MGPNARSVVQALKKIDLLPNIKTIGVGHGPILNFNTELWLNNYREWSSQRSKGENYAVVCYLSQYGFCDRLSQAIAHGIGKACLLYTSPSPRDRTRSRMPSSA